MKGSPLPSRLCVGLRRELTRGWPIPIWRTKLCVESDKKCKTGWVSHIFHRIWHTSTGTACASMARHLASGGQSQGGGRIVPDSTEIASVVMHVECVDGRLHFRARSLFTWWYFRVVLLVISALLGKDRMDRHGSLVLATWCMRKKGAGPGTLC